MSSKRALDCARVLRAVHFANVHHCSAIELLDVADERTLHRLFTRGGVEALLGDPKWSIQEFVDGQRFIVSRHVVDEIRRLMTSRFQVHF